jgi:hypothetical protein
MRSVGDGLGTTIMGGVLGALCPPLGAVMLVAGISEIAGGALSAGIGCDGHDNEASDIVDNIGKLPGRGLKGLFGGLKGLFGD